MSGFKPLNIESDDESDIEVDDTKELQIEDGLKLYQAALKLHAEGPPSFDKAAQAYQELFESEIFNYPESQPELRRIELYGPVIDVDDSLDGVQPGVVVANGGLDAGPSTLPQILHLSHKNYAQFRLEYLSAQIEHLHVTLGDLVADALVALDHFMQALDKDDSDLDLWRRTAAVGRLVNSKRVARFCLEAVLDGDDEGLNSVLSLPGLEEGLAADQLRHLIAEVDDRLSMLQGPLSMTKRRVLSHALKQRLETYTDITSRQKALELEQGDVGPHIQQPQRLVLETPSTWAELGDIVLRQLIAEQHGTSSLAPAAAICFDAGQMPPANRKAVKASEPAISAAPSPALSTKHGSIASALINEQFPGLDHGKPTAQPQIAPAEDSMRYITHPNLDNDHAMTDSPIMTLPSRKRSGDAAGLGDGNDEVRTTRKRIRARDSNADTGDSRQAIIDANARWEYEQQLNEFQAADDWMFETVGNLFERIGVVGFEAAKDVRQELQPSDPHGLNGVDQSESAVDDFHKARSDIYDFLQSYGDHVAYVLSQNAEALELGQRASIGGAGGTFTAAAGLNAVGWPTMPEDALPDFIAYVNDRWLLTKDVAWHWMCRMLSPSVLHTSAYGNSYSQYTWPEPLKTMVVRILVNFDEHIHERASSELEFLASATRLDELTERRLPQIAEMVHSIYELHLDIHTLIKAPNSGVDAETITAQGERLRRWSRLAQEAMHFRAVIQASADVCDELSLRFLWTTTFDISAAGDVSQDHIIACMKDLRGVLVSAGEPTIYLQNNAVMPELSVVTLDREISRLTTKDFFHRVTSQDLGDPVAVIESLEPLLESLAEPRHDQDNDTSSMPDESSTSVAPELVRFLQSSDMSVRLVLWHRLRDAYLAIDYKAMVVSCYFKMMRMLLNEVKSVAHTRMSQHERQLAILKTLRLLQDMVAKSLLLVQSADNALECIDEDGLKAAVTMFGELLQILQVFNIFEDSIRVGQRQPPMLPNGLPVASFAAVNAMLHDMQLHIWIVLYKLLQEAIYQKSDLFPTPVEDRFDFLRCVHRNLGLRGICGGSNRVFVRMLKDEFLHMTHVEGYDSEQAQVLYDLYGLNCFLNPSYELIEHHCTHDAFFERGVAVQAAELLMQQASKLPIRELFKHSLKDTIEKVHGVAPKKKPSDALTRNRELFRAFTRSPIRPMDIYDCLKGVGNQLPVSTVPKDDALLASKGWYFLMGHIALTKFRSQKRTAPTPTEDLDIAIAFFMQDLEYDMDHWETWFRLAQAYDTKIEESVVWSAEKLNNSMPEIIQQQRIAIHSYTLATALAYRSADLAFETSAKLTDLHAEFAMRLYSSSREPFKMLPFEFDGTEIFVSAPNGIGRSKPFKPLRTYTAWKLAKTLWQRALIGKPQSWYLNFMLGKCLWKMHSAPPEVRQKDHAVSAQQVLSCFVRALELLPDKKDSREKREPVLEPHYKLVSIVHKMVSRGTLSLEEAQEVLQSTHYARTAPFPQELDEWVPHMLSVLKNLRAADKSNWHHRMVARAAQIIYDDSDPCADGSSSGNNLGAMGAKHELTQQMFTKTMVLQVWRPECERAGRHFVYTARYTRFFVKILEQLKDRTNLEQLARRVRRRPHDVFEHGLVWQDICGAYLRLLRNYAGLSEGLETSTFSNIAHEDFLARKEPLEKWMQAQDPGTLPALDVLREVQELKKINQGLMKPGPIDDLIGDSYASLFNNPGKQLLEEERRVKQEEEARRPVPAASPPRNPMMSLNHLMNLDGVNDQSPSNSQGSLPHTAATAITQQLEQAPARKKTGVGRREVRLCAESCLQRAAAVAVKNTLPSNTRVQVVIDNSRYYIQGDSSVETSAPGSIHDSADDESELSELEEEDDDDDDVAEASVKQEGGQPPRLMFPGLANIADSREPSQGFETADEGPASRAEDVEMVDAEESVARVPVVETRGDEQGA